MLRAPSLLCLSPATTPQTILPMPSGGCMSTCPSRSCPSVRLTRGAAHAPFSLNSDRAACQHARDPRGDRHPRSSITRSTNCSTTLIAIGDDVTDTGIDVQPGPRPARVENAVVVASRALARASSDILGEHYREVTSRAFFDRVSDRIDVVDDRRRSIRDAT